MWVFCRGYQRRRCSLLDRGHQFTDAEMQEGEIRNVARAEVRWHTVGPGQGRICALFSDSGLFKFNLNYSRKRHVSVLFCSVLYTLSWMTLQVHSKVLLHRMHHHHRQQGYRILFRVTGRTILVLGLFFSVFFGGGTDFSGIAMETSSQQ